jgi:hypothetical protein
MDWMNYDNAYSGGSLSLPVTVTPELPKWDFGVSAPSTYVDNTLPAQKAAPSGSNFLDGLTKAASSVFNLAGQAYQLSNRVEDAKFQRQVTRAEQDIRRAELSGAVDLRRATLEAQRSVGVAQANRAVADENARTQSSGVAYVQQGTNWLMIAGLGAGAYLLFKRGKA